MKSIKQRVSTIPLSLRGKKRYILFRASPSSVWEKSLVEKALFHHLLHSFGTLGMAGLRYRFITFNPENGMGILRCVHTHTSLVVAALLLVSSLNATPASVRTIRVSGSLLSLRSRLRGTQSRSS